MSYKKTIISFIFLLTYFVGFAHNLIPHCHEAENNHIQDNHHYQHHQHNTNQNDHERGHFLHEEHFDKNVYELLFCFLIDLEHPSKKCKDDHYLIMKGSDDPVKKSLQIRILAVVSSIVNTKRADKSEHTDTTQFTIQYSVPLLISIPLRGPPSFSC